MSELINNREKRQELLKGIINDLHAGHNMEELKARFEDLLGAVVSPTEISEMEQALINEGMPVEEIQALCDVHVEVFRESLDKQFEQAVNQTEESDIHPVSVLKQENEAISNLVADIESVTNQIVEAKVGTDISDQLKQWDDLHSKLLEVDKHYRVKENIIFPYLEKNGITGPPSVMWGIHDDIRDQLKQISKIIASTDNLADKQLTREICDVIQPCLNAIKEMVYKENNILIPMCQETLTEQEWVEVSSQTKEIGYTLIEPKVEVFEGDQDAQANLGDWQTYVPEGLLKFDSGILSLDEIARIFNALPVDITFVDKDDRVRYFSEGGGRIFDRTRAVIGRDVQNCHPPASVHIVEGIVNDFKKHKRDHADFWLKIGDKFVYIRYFAIYDDNNEYLGTLEVTQDIAPLQEISGEKRIDDHQ